MRAEYSDSESLMHGGAFATTHWSVVLAAGERNTPRSDAALDQLCRAYWYPIYAYIRRQGYGVPDAQDLTQGFFAHLLSRGTLRRANPDRGKFRSFLLGSLKYFLADELARLQAQKRGGGCMMVFLDAASAEDRYRMEPVEQMDAEKLFERRWALALLDRVLERLEADFAQEGKSRLFQGLRQFLLGEEGVGTYREAAAALGMTEGGVKVAVHRMRQRYRELFREEIVQTLNDPAEAEEEMRHVFAAISR